jgi:hypothetical protein
VSLVDSLDLGASLAPAAPCLVTESATLSYAETQGLSRSISSSLGACGVAAGQTVGVLSANDPLALTCIFGASRAGAAWALVDPVEATVEELVDELRSCSLLLVRTADADLARALLPQLPLLETLVCLDGTVPGALGWGEFLVAGLTEAGCRWAEPPATACAEEQPRDDRPVFLALRPLSQATSVRWGPVLAQGGRIVMRDHGPSASLSALEA